MLSSISVSPPDYTASSSVRCKAHPTLEPSPRARTTAVWHSIIVINQARVADYDADNDPVPEVERALEKIRNPPDAADFRTIQDGPQSLRVFGCLPGTGARGCMEAGVRKASREETAGEFATAVVSIYGDLAPVLDLICRFQTGTRVERAAGRWLWPPWMRSPQ